MRRVTPKKKYLNELLQGFTAAHLPAEIEIVGIASDSRLVQAGYLFLACQGAAEDRLEYVRAALEQGAIAVAIDETYATEAQSLAADVPLIAINDLSLNLGFIAARFFDRPSAALALIGITGTNGKTTCSHLLAQCLDKHNQRCGIIGTMGYGFFDDLLASANTTPGSIELQSRLYQLQHNSAKAVAMEVSSHGLAQNRTTGCHFSIAVFTNLTRDHLDYHGSMQAYGAAKLELFREPELDAAIINLDDAFAAEVIKAVSANAITVGVSLMASQSLNTDYFIHGVILERSLAGTKFMVQSSWGEALFHTPLLGDYNVNNLLLVLGVVIQQGVSLDETLGSIATLHASKGRLESFGKQHQPLVIVDYAHTPDALEKVLQTLQAYAQGELWVLFGCGGERDAGKRSQMGKIAEHFADHVWLTSDNPRSESAENIVNDILAGISKPENIIIQPSRELAIAEIIAAAAANDIVLIAGKGHEEYQLIGNEILPFSDRAVVARTLGVAA